MDWPLKKKEKHFAEFNLNSERYNHPFAPIEAVIGLRYRNSLEEAHKDCCPAVVQQFFIGLELFWSGQSRF